MSPFVIKGVQLLLSISLLVILHELGHFIPAKLFKTRVEKFFLFFDVKFALFKKKIGDTVYGIGWLPLGGYVKIAGMVDESMDTEQMKRPAQPWEFRSKPAWQRLIIMLGGVTVNFLLALFIYIVLAYSYGEQYIVNDSVVAGIYVTEPRIGDAIGIQTGDKVVAVDGEEIERFDDIFLEIVNGNTITIERDNTIQDLTIPVDFISTLSNYRSKFRFLTFRWPFVIKGPSESSVNAAVDFREGDQILQINGKPAYYFDQVKSILNEFAGQTVTIDLERANSSHKTLKATVSPEGTLGIPLKVLTLEEYQKKGVLQVETKKYSFFESIPKGIERGVTTLSGYVKQFKKILNPETGAYKGVGGFGAIGNLFPNSWDWRGFWNSTALISIILAFMNILPIPALDGGHVVFLLYEIVSGRRPNEKVLEYAQMVGLFLLLAILLFANGNDIYRAISS